MKKEYLIPAVNLYECKETFCTDMLSFGIDFGGNNWDDLEPEDGY